MSSILPNSPTPNFNGNAAINHKANHAIMPPSGPATVSDAIHINTAVKGQEQSASALKTTSKSGVSLWKRSQAGLKGTCEGFLKKGLLEDVACNLILFPVFWCTSPSLGLAAKAASNSFLLNRGIRAVVSLGEGLIKG